MTPQKTRFLIGLDILARFHGVAPKLSSRVEWVYKSLRTLISYLNVYVTPVHHLVKIVIQSSIHSAVMFCLLQFNSIGYIM